MRFSTTTIILFLVLATGGFAANAPAGDNDEPKVPQISWDRLKTMMRATLPPKRTASAGTPSSSTTGAPERCKCCGQLVPSKAAPASGSGPVASAAEVVVVSLRGRFSEGGLCGYIGEDCTDMLLELALERDPTAIVLDIDSKGGLVTTMEHIIERLLDAQTKQKVRVIAWPSLAGSAAAVTCMSCR